MSDDTKKDETKSPEATTETTALTVDAGAELAKTHAELEALKKSYSSVQRELGKARRRGGDTKALSDQIMALRDQVVGLGQVIASAEFVSSEAKSSFTRTSAEAVDKAKRAETLEKLYEFYETEINDILSDAGLDWDDPRLDKAREAFDSGNNPLEAARLTRKVALQATRVDPATIESAVNKKVEEALKKSGARTVDTKESTAGTPGGFRLDDFLKKTPAERRAMSDKLRDAIRRGELG